MSAIPACDGSDTGGCRPSCARCRARARSRGSTGNRRRVETPRAHARTESTACRPASCASIRSWRGGWRARGRRNGRSAARSEAPRPARPSPRSSARSPTRRRPARPARRRSDRAPRRSGRGFAACAGESRASRSRRPCRAARHPSARCRDDGCRLRRMRRARCPPRPRCRTPCTARGSVGFLPGTAGDRRREIFSSREPSRVAATNGAPDGEQSHSQSASDPLLNRFHVIRNPAAPPPCETWEMHYRVRSSCTTFDVALSILK